MPESTPPLLALLGAQDSDQNQDFKPGQGGGKPRAGVAAGIPQLGEGLDRQSHFQEGVCPDQKAATARPLWT